jgi:hypothetical protein
MAITIRDTRPGAPPIKRNIASLVGGYVIAFGCFVLFLLVASELTALTWPVILGGFVFALAVGIWVRMADL